MPVFVAQLVNPGCAAAKTRLRPRINSPVDGAVSATDGVASPGMTAVRERVTAPEGFWRGDVPTRPLEQSIVLEGAERGGRAAHRRPLSEDIGVLSRGDDWWVQLIRCAVRGGCRTGDAGRHRTTIGLPESSGRRCSHSARFAKVKVYMRQSCEVSADWHTEGGTR